VAEVSMIERVIAHLAGHGIDEVVLSMGYKPDAFVAAFPEGTCQGVRLSYAVEPERLDTGGGIAFAARHAGLDETFVVINGDVLTDLDLTELVAFHRERGGEATIALTPVDDPSAFGVVPTDEAGRVTAFIEKPPRDEAPTNFINAGFYVLEPSVLDRIPVDDPSAFGVVPTDERGRVTAFIEKPARDEAPTNFINAGFYVFEPSVIDRVPVDGVMHLESQVFPAMVDEGVLYALGSSLYWTDTGTPPLYLQANLDYVRGLRGDVPSPGAREREPGVWTLGAGVIDGTVLPASLIGDAAFVAGGATVEESIVGGGARVEAGATVRSSLLLPGAVVRAGAVVEHSIIGEGAVIGEEATVVDLTVVEGRAVVEAGAAESGGRVAATVA
jgi:NDP-sugar pyrophosphorylase family protein